MTSLFQQTPASAANISGCGRYRYWLTRTWDESRPKVTFVMLNPSTADAEKDDPTIRRCIDFAKRWGCGGLCVVNLFAYRSSKPVALATVEDPVGPGNDDVILNMSRNRRVIVAWGATGAKYGKRRIPQVLKLLDGQSVECLKLTDDGHPWHPLYVPADTVPIRFGGAA
jgi:hypothetical protein